MSRNKRNLIVFEKVEILDAGAEGKAIARVHNKVIFIPYVVPGDIVDIQITRKKKTYLEGKAVNFYKYSDKRAIPFCKHFGLCGGCKWQNMKYEYQLFYKQKQVIDNLQRIGKLDIPEIMPIIPAKNTRFYRNKLDFTFSNRKWLTKNFNKDDLNSNKSKMNGLGFHIPGIFDRIVDINYCYLQKEPSNAIRLSIKKYAIENKLSFYDVRKWSGFLRNLIIRNSNTGDLMIILVFNYEDKTQIEKLLNFIYEKFPEITSLMYVINNKKNDVISDLKINLYKGLPYIIEKMHSGKSKELKFKIGPVSFFQTNSQQAYELYKVVLNFADLKGEEIVYDLYTGTGTIANFIAESAKKVIGIDLIQSAIEDAKENSKINKIDNTFFYAGDIVNVLKEDFIKNNGKADVIITDPPRAGMHKKILKQIINISPEKIVYISCNPATQARDIALIDEYYKIDKMQAIDMFPHTQHIENVILLKKIFEHTSKNDIR